MMGFLHLRRRNWEKGWSLQGSRQTSITKKILKSKYPRWVIGCRVRSRTSIQSLISLQALTDKEKRILMFWRTEKMSIKIEPKRCRSRWNSSKSLGSSHKLLYPLDPQGRWNRQGLVVKVTSRIARVLGCLQGSLQNLEGGWPKGLLAKEIPGTQPQIKMV